jgi:hypothetical protein
MREKLIELFYENNVRCDQTIEGLVDDVQSIISTADVVEVVRCKNCDVPHNKWTGCPHLNGLIPPPDFYCAKGTPKERGGETALKERENV